MNNQTSEIRAQKWAEIVIACNLHIPFASCHLHGKILPLCR